MAAIGINFGITFIKSGAVCDGDSTNLVLSETK